MIHLLKRFQQLPDYRKCKQLKFNVGETLFMSLLALLSGANGYADMEMWIKSRKKELAKLLGHPFIAPADNTIRNVFLNIELLMHSIGCLRSGHMIWHETKLPKV